MLLSLLLGNVYDDGDNRYKGDYGKNSYNSDKRDNGDNKDDGDNGDNGINSDNCDNGDNSQNNDNSDNSNNSDNRDLKQGRRRTGSNFERKHVSAHVRFCPRSRHSSSTQRRERGKASFDIQCRT